MTRLLFTSEKKPLYGKVKKKVKCVLAGISLLITIKWNSQKIIISIKAANFNTKKSKISAHPRNQSRHSFSQECINSLLCICFYLYAIVLCGYCVIYLHCMSCFIVKWAVPRGHGCLLFWVCTVDKQNFLVKREGWGMVETWAFAEVPLQNQIQ